MTPAAVRGHPFVVVVDGARHREWGRYRTQDEAQAACAALLRHGLVARIVYGPEVIDAVTAGADE